MNESATKRNLCFAAGIVVIIAISYIFSQLWIMDELKKSCFDMGFRVSGAQTEDYSVSYINSHVGENGAVVSDGEGAGIEIQLASPMFVDDIMLDIEIFDGDNSSQVQVYYAAENESYSDSKAAVMTCSAGQYDFSVDKEDCRSLRIIYSNEAGAEIKVNDMYIYECAVDEKSTALMIFISAALILILYCAVYKEQARIKPCAKLYRLWAGLTPQCRSRILLHTAVLATVAVVFGKLTLDGRLFIYNDIGADTKDSYIPLYTNIIKSLREGTPDIWSAELGLGAPLLRRMGNFANPFIALLILLGVIFGEQALPVLIIVVFALVVLANAEMCFRYLNIFCKEYHITALVAYIFSFNSFTVIWGQHYFFQIYPLYMLVTLYGIEKYLRQDKRRCGLIVILSAFALMLQGAYIAYMTLLPAAVYAIIRYVQLNDRFVFRQFFAKLFHLLLNVLLGMLGGMLLGLTNLAETLGSARMSASASTRIDTLLGYLGDWYFPEEFIQRLQTLISGNLSGIGSYYKGVGYSFDYYNATQLFFSVFCIIFLLQYIFTLHRTYTTAKQRVCGYLSAFLVFMCVSNLGFTFILYGMTDISQRCLFSILPFLALMSARVLDNIFVKKIFSRAGLLIGLAASVICLMQPYIRLEDSSVTKPLTLLVAADLVILVAGACVLLYSCSGKKLNTHAAVFAMAALVFANVTLETTASINRSGAIPIEQWENSTTQSEKVEKALDYIDSIDSSYYRIEKTFFDYTLVNDSLQENYRSVTTYDSNMKSGLAEYCAYYLDIGNSAYPRWLFPIFSHELNDVVQYSELGVKYIIGKYAEPYNFPQNDDLYEFVASIEDLNIYRNKAVNSFTTFFTQAVTESDFLALGRAERAALQSNTIVIDDIYADAAAEHIVTAQAALESYRQTDISKTATVNGLTSEAPIYMNTEYIMAMSENWSEELDGDAYLEFSFIPEKSGTLCIYFNTGEGYDYVNNLRIRTTAGKLYEARRLLPDNTKGIYCRFNDVPVTLNYMRIYDSMEGIRPMTSPMEIEDTGSDSHLEGTIECAENGLLFIPIPYRSEWEIAVDGQPIEIYVANSGFMAIELTEGKHTVTLDYVPRALYIGIICFMAAVLLTLLYYFYPRIFAGIKAALKR